MEKTGYEEMDTSTSLEDRHPGEWHTIAFREGITAALFRALDHGHPAVSPQVGKYRENYLIQHIQ